MTDYLKTGPLDEKEMRPEYRQAEEAYREQARSLWDENEQIKRSIRTNLDLSPEEREDRYMEAYESRIAPKFAELSSTFVSTVMEPVGEDQQLLTQGQGARFADHLIALAGKEGAELEKIMDTAQRTGQTDLVRAAAQVALDNNQFGVFDKWAATEPKRAEALKRIRTTPGPEQLATRANAMQPPKADGASLTPTAEDHQRAQEAASAKAFADESRRRGFYGVRRMTGRRSEVV